MSDYRFRPWRGSRYESADWPVPHCRVLVLGESHYNLNAEPAGPEFTQRCIEEQTRGEWKKAYWTKLMRVLGGEQATPEVWQCVAFYNYVQHWVGTGPRQAPTAESWAAAQSLFRKALTELQPTHILAVSYRLWNHMDPGDGGPAVQKVLGGVERSIRQYEVAGCTASLIAIPHPSSRPFPKQDWHGVLQAFLKLGSH